MLYYLFITSLCLLLFWVAYKGLLQSDTLFVRNRLYLLLSSAFALVLPFIDISGLINRLFIQEETLPQELLLPYYSTTITAEVPKETMWQAGEVVTCLWCAVAALLLLQSAFQIGRLYQFAQERIREAIPAGKLMPSLPAAMQAIAVIPTQGKLPTSSFGKWLFWDNTQPLAAHELESILLHEYAHIAQRHTWDVLYMELFRAVLWFHPVAWLYVRELRSQHEYLADAAATRNTAPQAYIRLMAMATLQSNHLQPIHTFFSVSSVKKRMIMLNKPKTSLLRGHLKTVAALGIVAAVGITAACTNSLDRLMRDQQVAEANKYEKIAPTATSNGSDEIFTIVEKSAEPEGGISEFLKMIGTNMRYPVEARRAGVEGKVFVQFVIDEQGNLTSSEVVKGVSPEIDAEALRVVKLSGKWTPGEQRGRKVKQRIVLPIVFSLGTGNPAVISVDGSQNMASSPQMSYGIPEEFNGLILIDGKEATAEELKALPANSIKRLNVLKLPEKVSPYGEKGKNGVLEVFTDKTAGSSQHNVIEIKSAALFGQQQNGKPTDKPAEPQGGSHQFLTYITQNLRYPAEARRANVQGKVFVEFVVDEQGNITQPKIRQGVSPELDAEALRIIQNSERWTPAEHEGKRVKQTIVLPISFSLGE
jgi:TonB family protein